MKTCPECGHPLDAGPTASSNRPDTITLEIPVALLPSLEHAFAVARNTAMMCHEPQSKKAFEALRKKISETSPAISKHFPHEGNFAELLFAFSDGIPIETIIVVEGSWNPSYRVCVVGPEGHKWPRANFKEPNRFSSSEFDTEEEAKAVLAEIDELRHRLSPMSG